MPIDSPRAVVLTQCILPSSLKLRARIDPARALVIHTTGRGLTGKATQLAGHDATRAEVDEAAIGHYENGTLPYFGGWFVGWGGVYQLAADDRQCQHSGSLGLHYNTAAWMDVAKPLSPKGVSGLSPHGRPGRTVYDWWLARWAPGLTTPLGLPTGRTPNAASIGIDLLPQLDGTYSADQVTALRWLVRKLCEQHGIPLDRRHVLGHEDVDPCARGTVLRKGKVLGVPWDPGALDWSALGLAPAPPLEATT